MEPYEDLLYFEEDQKQFPVSLWSNTNGAIAPIHYDSSNIWHGMLRGRKRFLYLKQKDIFSLYLFPPSHPQYRNSMVRSSVCVCACVCAHVCACVHVCMCACVMGVIVHGHDGAADGPVSTSSA